MQIRKVIIDVLIPHTPDILAYAEKISDLEEVEGLTIGVVEVDERTKTLEMAIEGEGLSFSRIRETVEDLGGSIHSIDEVSAGSRIVQLRKKPRKEPW